MKDRYESGLNFKSLPSTTREQLAWLQDERGYQNRTTLFVKAVDTLYREERGMSYFRAKVRVEHTPELAEHAETIMYDWAEADEHWAWIANAPVVKIVEWAQEVEQAHTETLESLDRLCAE